MKISARNIQAQTKIKIQSQTFQACFKKNSSFIKRFKISMKRFRHHKKQFSVQKIFCFFIACQSQINRSFQVRIILNLRHLIKSFRKSKKFFKIFHKKNFYIHKKNFSFQKIFQLGSNFFSTVSKISSRLAFEFAK